MKNEVIRLFFSAEKNNNLGKTMQMLTITCSREEQVIVGTLGTVFSF